MTILEPPYDKAEAEKPRRIQRKRTKGWKMPPNTIYVGRPSKWGNPYSLKNFREFAVMEYRPYLASRLHFQDLDINELRGKNLACWCPLNLPCHADVLLELANT